MIMLRVIGAAFLTVAAVVLVSITFGSLVLAFWAVDNWREAVTAFFLIGAMGIPASMLAVFGAAMAWGGD